jgi:very-short-patch-repair endonuclease
LLRRHGLSCWTANARVVHEGRIIARAEVLFTAARLIVEVDGYEAHSGPEQFRRDRQRQNALVAAGYTVLRVTWDDLTRSPEVLIGQLRLLLATAA